jgi:hypothetical protein
MKTCYNLGTSEKYSLVNLLIYAKHINVVWLHVCTVVYGCKIWSLSGSRQLHISDRF